MPRALLSVYDKTDLVDFSSGLLELGFELISTGGTYTALHEAGLAVVQVSEITGSPEILDGRVKTLHPTIHGGLLARRDLPDHLSQLREHGITAIDMLVSNLYPFEATVADRTLDDGSIVEQIDIGGPAMIRAASKNFTSVVVVTNPMDYGDVLNRVAIDGNDIEWRRALAARAFGHVSTYDSLVAEFLRITPTEFPEELSIGMRRVSIPRYGENAHQSAAAYRRLSVRGTELGMLDAVQRGGKEMSYNNYLDADAALVASRIRKDPTVAIVKHTVPCGLATRDSLIDAFNAAYAGDPISAFGGIVASNRPFDAETATKLVETLFDIVIAPGFSNEVIEILKIRKNLRVLDTSALGDFSPTPPLDIRPIRGGFLVQEPDTQEDDQGIWQVVTERQPTASERADLEYAWSAARLVKSNAIVFAKDGAVVGLGAGQPNRLESVALAIRKAGDRARGTALASDAFFPFPDGIEIAAAAGVTAIIQPGGGMRDKTVIRRADELGLTMILTGTRHFRH
ncbi:MAG: bifunctional phosphoribosylaminoimidazolecarboxamide formyltransferase/IMP cyclohydrolase [Thermomicrobiales bacterium]